MTDTSLPTPPRERIFLVVVDESEEMRVALRYAALRAFHTGGRVALLSVIEPPGVQISQAVEERMAEERRDAAEKLISTLTADVKRTCGGTVPVVYIREGRRRDELFALIGEEPSITVLVLAAGAGQEGPGPLITALIGRSGQLRVPITIVPGSLSDEQIAALA